MMLTAATMPMFTATMAQGETALPESSYGGTVDVSETSKPEVLSNPIVEVIKTAPTFVRCQSKMPWY